MWRAPHLPFFLLSSVWAALIPLVWLWPGLVPDPGRWHAQEMILGVAGAAMAGYLLTALPHWQKAAGARPTHLGGPRLRLLVVLWLAGRLAGVWLAGTLMGMALLYAFPAILSLFLSAAALRSRLWARLPIAAAPGLMALGAAQLSGPATGLTAVLGLALLISLVGGRILPAFLAARVGRDGPGTGNKPPPALGERLTSLPVAAALALNLSGAAPGLVAAAMWLAALSELLRMVTWRGLGAGFGRGDLRLLLFAWLWLPAGLAMAAAGLGGGAIAILDGHLHGLAMGAAGSMILAVQSRAALPRRDGAVVVPVPIGAAFGLVQIAAVVRLAAAAAPEILVPLAGCCWAAGWGLAAVSAARAVAAPLPHPVLSGRR